jgi:hypothetical protein
MPRKTISDSYMPGTIIDVRRIDGLEGTYINLTVGAWVNQTIHSDGRLMALSYTPPVDCWWELDAVGYLTCGTAAYTYTQSDILLTPADADGFSTMQEIMSGQYNGVVTYYSPKVHRLFKLTAGVAYTAQFRHFLQASSMTAYRGGTYTWMLAKAIVR